MARLCSWPATTWLAFSLCKTVIPQNEYTSIKTSAAMVAPTAPKFSSTFFLILYITHEVRDHYMNWSSPWLFAKARHAEYSNPQKKEDVWPYG